jgi:2-C-methyl-D-erythritol 4-phosphate cytidylyltransferase
VVHEWWTQETRVIAALILAGGQGMRFGAANRPKQFSEICGKPLFIHALQTYVELAGVDPVLLIANPAFMDISRTALRQFRLEAHVSVAPGGDTRQESVRNGLAALGELHEVRDQDAIVLHNAASPNTPAETVTRCIAALETAEVAQAYVPELRTLFAMNEQRVAAVLPRPGLACACDPTVYRVAALRRVMKRQAELGLRGDTTTDIALSLGMRIELVESVPGNIKITARWDMGALKAAMEEAASNFEPDD